MAAAAGAGTVELVNAALAPYAHPDLRWLVRRHVLAVLHDFPSLSPSVDAYTSDSGASAVLLNARGLLTVSSALPPLVITLWLPREYPYLPPLVYALPAAPPASLVPDHPFVDHRTGRVRQTLPYLDGWRVPESSLSGLVRSLVGALRMCHPLMNSFGFIATATEDSRPEVEKLKSVDTALVDALAARLGTDTDAYRRRVDRDIHCMSSLQDSLRARADAMDRAVRELEEELMGLERAVAASLRHRGQLLSWLRQARHAPDAVAALEPQAAAGADASQWLESKASELAIDDAMDALGHALENGAVGFKEYIKRVKILAREQFLHCYTASTSLKKISPRQQVARNI